VDGIYIDGAGYYASMAHSEKEHRPWWRVDLVDFYCVWAVNILNRANSEWQLLNKHLLIFINTFVVRNCVIKLFLHNQLENI